MVAAKKRRKNATTSTVSLSLFLSRVSGSIKYNVPELKFLPSLLFFFFLARNVFFFINPKIEKSQTKDIKKIIFLVFYRKEEGRKRALKSAHLRRRDGRVLLFSRLSFCLSLSLRKTEENPSDDDAKRDDVKPPPFAEKKRDDRHVSVVARAHVRGKSAKKSTTRGGVV